MDRTGTRCAVLTTALGLCASAANAGVVGDAVTITATSANGKTASYSVPMSGAPWQKDQWNWVLPSAIDLKADDGTVLGHLSSLSVGYIADPVVTWQFSMQAGSIASTFTFTSGQLNFGMINSAVARASAAITVTDGDGNGATLTGQYAGAKAYDTHFNGTVGGSGSDFGFLVSGVTAGAYASATSSESKPISTGFDTTGSNINSMQTEFKFQLTPNDLASGTSVFVVVPTPGAVSLGTLGCLVAGRRRRR